MTRRDELIDKFKKTLYIWSNINIAIKLLIYLPIMPILWSRYFKSELVDFTVYFLGAETILIREIIVKGFSAPFYFD